MECFAVAMTETQLKEILKKGTAQVYVFYGAESYLVEQYARLVAKQTVEEGFDAFNFHRFDGQTVTEEQLEEAVESLPMMSERKCVSVRDLDVSAADSARLIRLVEQMPESCVLVFWQMTVIPDKRKNAWKEFLKAAEEKGVVMEFKRKEPADAAKMLMAGAKRRGCRLDFDEAMHLVEQVGNDLNRLIGELDKLCALAEEGAITRALIDRACPKTLEGRVYDLSKAILRRRAGEAYDLLHQFKTQREQPVAVLAVLSGAYADLYRAKVASAGGMPAERLAADFACYKGKDWRLKNAARDGARMSLSVLRDCLDVLGKADVALKSSSADPWMLLEQTVTRLMSRAAEG